jgi:acetyl esterase/lipase
MRAFAWCCALAALAVAGRPAQAEEAKGKVAPFEVKVALDVPYNQGEDAHARHNLDLYLPAGRKDFPVFFFIHGGGWRAGTKDLFARHGLTFAKNGIGFVAINYRLTTHPDHIKDVARAFAWTVKNIGKYGGKVDCIFVGGHSAGGHLCALLATDKTYLEAYKLSPANIKGVVPISGVFDVTNERMAKTFGDEDSRKAASPMTHVKGKLPPMLILYADGEKDRLGKQAEAFGKALAKVKSEASVKVIKDRNHGSIMARIVQESDPATKLIFEFIARHCAKEPRKEAKKVE